MVAAKTDKADLSLYFRLGHADDPLPSFTDQGMHDLNVYFINETCAWACYVRIIINSLSHQFS